MLETVLALVLAGLLLAVIYVMTEHSIIVVNRKDPAMATIKERLAALEAAVKALQPVDTSGLATAESVAALGSKVDDLANTVGTHLDAIDAEIGSDPAPADAQPAPDAPVDQPAA